MAQYLSKTELKALIDANVTKDRIIWGTVLNQLLTNFIDSLKFDFVVVSTAVRNALTDKYAGMIVYVRNDQLYVLEDDLTTWTPIIKDTYTQAQVNSLLANKVDVDGGKVLSDLNFTSTLKDKLDAIEAQATKNLTDAALLSRSSHTGTQAIDTIISLQDVLDGFSDDLALLIPERFILRKSIVLTTSSVYQIDAAADYTILVDATSGNKIVVMPDLNDPTDLNNGTCFNIVKVDSSVNSVTVYAHDYQDSNSGSGSQSGTGFSKIDFGYKKYLTTQGALINLQGYNNNWYKISD